MTGTRDHWIETPKGKLFARVWGEVSGAAPIILLHDSLGSVELWRDFPAMLAARTARAVVAYDRLGFGRSDPYPGRLPPDFVQREAREGFDAVRRGLGIGKMIPFGHSVGGGMALAAAAAFPDDCAAAITEAAQAFIEPRTLDGIRAAKVQFALPGEIERLARYHGEKACWVLEAWTGTWLHRDFADWTLAGEIARVAAPLLVLHGTRDEYGSPAQPERIARLAGGQATCRILDGLGHIPHREAPERVLSLVADFLSGIEPAAARPPGNFPL